MKPFIFIMAVLGLLIMPVVAEPVPFNESVSGDRNIGQNFTFIMNNISYSTADVVYHHAVYDYRIIGDNYTYYSPNWGQWFTKDADPDKKYLAVWVRGILEGQESYIGWGADRFMAWVKDKTIEPEPVHMQDLSIGQYQQGFSKETIEKKAVCGDAVTYQTQIRYTTNIMNSTTRRLPAVIRELENRMATSDRGWLTTERYGWKDENEQDRIEPGYSNRYDGYILYQIPEDSRPEDIRIAGHFRNWGTAVWYLTETEIDQDSAERYQRIEQALMELQRDTGIRLPDTSPGRTEA